MPLSRPAGGPGAASSGARVSAKLPSAPSDASLSREGSGSAPEPTPLRRRSSSATEQSFGRQRAGSINSLHSNSGWSFRQAPRAVESELERSCLSVASDSRRREQLARIAHKGVKQIKARVATPASPSSAPKVFTMRERIYCLFDPSALMPSVKYARASTAIAIVILVLIFVSVTVFLIESLPQFEANPAQTLYSIEAVCVGVFTLEYTSRLVTTPDRPGFLRDVYNWIDFVAVIPFWVDLLLRAIGANAGTGGSLVFLRLLRLIRVLRVFKLGQYSRPLQIVLFTLARSVTALSLLVFLLGIGTVLFSSLMFIAEQTSDGQSFDKQKREWVRANGVRSPFQSIPHCFWWAMVTLTTVGYGDSFPVSATGKLVGAGCILVGLFVVAFPVILISHNFSEVMFEFQEVQQLQEAEEKALQEAEREQELDRQESALTCVLRRLDGGAHVEPSPAHDEEKKKSQPTVESVTSPCADPLELSAAMGGASLVGSSGLATSSLGGSAAGSGGSLSGQRRPPDPQPAWSTEQQPHNPLVPPDSHFSGKPLTPLRRPRVGDLPPVRSFVANFRYDQRGKPRQIFFYGMAGEVPQFRYEPLFVPLTTITGELDTMVRSRPAISQFFVHLEVCLDSERAQTQCHEAASRCGIFEPRRVPRQGSCCASSLRRASLRIPHLPAGCRVGNDTWHCPGGVIPVHISAPDGDTLSRLVRLLPDLTLHFTCVWIDAAGAGRAPSGMHSRVAAIDAAVSAGVLTPEEADRKRQQFGAGDRPADVFEVTVPLGVSRQHPVSDPRQSDLDLTVPAGLGAEDHEDSVLYENLRET